MGNVCADECTNYVDMLDDNVERIRSLKVEVNVYVHETGHADKKSVVVHTMPASIPPDPQGVLLDPHFAQSPTTIAASDHMWSPRSAPSSMAMSSPGNSFGYQESPAAPPGAGVAAVRMVENTVLTSRCASAPRRAIVVQPTGTPRKQQYVPQDDQPPLFTKRGLEVIVLDWMGHEEKVHIGRQPLGAKFVKKPSRSRRERVIISHVAEGSQAEDLGLQVGWVIKAVAGEDMTGKSFEETQQALTDGMAVLPGE